MVAICLLQIKPLTRPERSWNLAIITPDPDLFVNNRSDIISQDLIFQSQRYFCHMVAPPPQQHGAKSTNWCLNNWTYVVFFNIFFLNICFLFSTFVEMPFIKWLRQLEMWCQSNVWILLKCWNLWIVSWREIWIPKKLFWSCRCSNTWWTRKNGCGARGCELCERLGEFFRSASEFAALELWSRLAAPGTARYLAGFFNQSGFTNISDCHRKLDLNSCPLVMIGSQDTQIIKLRQQTICNAWHHRLFGSKKKCLA